MPVLLRSACASCEDKAFLTPGKKVQDDGHPSVSSLRYSFCTRDVRQACFLAGCCLDNSVAHALVRLPRRFAFNQIASGAWHRTCADAASLAWNFCRSGRCADAGRTRQLGTRLVSRMATGLLLRANIVWSWLARGRRARSNLPRSDIGSVSLSRSPQNGGRNETWEVSPLRRRLGGEQLLLRSTQAAQMPPIASFIGKRPCGF